MKVFWSWQSDTPKNTGRHFIKGALADAIKKLNADPETISEPTERDDPGEIELDHDTKGIPGSPDLVDTILKKIDAASVVVADVTCVGEIEQAEKKKKFINSNVALELGYALKSLTTSRLVLVFNDYYGSHLDLPFDLRHKGGAITFTLAPDADALTIKLEKAKLTSWFVSSLRAVLSQVNDPATKEFVETPSTYCKAAYFNKGGVIAERLEEREKRRFSYLSETLFYMRLIPVRVVKTVPNTRLHILAQKTPLLGPNNNPSSEGIQNKHGVICVAPASHFQNGHSSISSSSQLFRNGEVWCIGTSLVRLAQPLEANPELQYRSIPYGNFEGTYRGVATKLLELQKSYPEVGKCRMICGISGTEGLYLCPYINGRFGPFHLSEIESDPVITDNADAVEDALVAFFTKVWDEAGEVRPPGYI